MVRLTTFLTALVGLYPQYRALRTVLMGRGWIAGDWEKEHKFNNRNLYVIEPLVESLLQVSLIKIGIFPFLLLPFLSDNFTQKKDI